MTFGSLPGFAVRNGIVVSKIRELKKEFPNDAEFGKVVREYLNAIDEGKVFKYTDVDEDLIKNE
jgi:hypothetical protein